MGLEVDNLRNVIKPKVSATPSTKRIYHDIMKVESAPCINPSNFPSPQVVAEVAVAVAATAEEEEEEEEEAVEVSLKSFAKQRAVQ